MTSTASAIIGRGGSNRFSGHETFSCRYAWLPKAYRGLQGNPQLFSDDDSAMIELGLGKNMVRSLRFWVEAMGIAEPDGERGLRTTAEGRMILREGGLDPFLEDARTLWLIHWNLSSRGEGGLFAWNYLLHRWPHPEFTRSELQVAFVRECARLGHAHSLVTLTQHLDIFLRTYMTSRSTSSGVEDSLDGPLTSLGLLQPVGQRKAESGRWEPSMAFRREEKAEIDAALFAYCLHDYWDRFHPADETLTQRQVALGFCSPGQIFKLPEDDVRSRLEAYEGGKGSSGFSYHPSAVQGMLTRRRSDRPTISDVYVGAWT